MSDFEKPQDSLEWARNRRMIIRCNVHPSVEHDRNIECPECQKGRLKQEAEVRDKKHNEFLSLMGRISKSNLQDDCHENEAILKARIATIYSKAMITGADLEEVSRLQVKLDKLENIPANDS